MARTRLPPPGPRCCGGPTIFKRAADGSARAVARRAAFANVFRIEGVSLELRVVDNHHGDGPITGRDIRHHDRSPKGQTRTQQPQRANSRRSPLVGSPRCAARGWGSIDQGAGGAPESHELPRSLPPLLAKHDTEPNRAHVEDVQAPGSRAHARAAPQRERVNQPPRGNLVEPLPHPG